MFCEMILTNSLLLNVNNIMVILIDIIDIPLKFKESKLYEIQIIDFYCTTGQGMFHRLSLMYMFFKSFHASQITINQYFLKVNQVPSKYNQVKLDPMSAGNCC